MGEISDMLLRLIKWLFRDNHDKLITRCGHDFDDFGMSLYSMSRLSMSSRLTILVCHGNFVCHDISYLNFICHDNPCVMSLTTLVCHDFSWLCVLIIFPTITLKSLVCRNIHVTTLYDFTSCHLIWWLCMSWHLM